MDQYQILSTLHTHDNATVKLAQHKTTGDRCVMKIIYVPSQDDSDDSDTEDDHHHHHESGPQQVRPVIDVTVNDNLLLRHDGGTNNGNENDEDNENSDSDVDDDNIEVIETPSTQVNHIQISVDYSDNSRSNRSEHLNEENGENGENGEEELDEEELRQRMKMERQRQRHERQLERNVEKFERDGASIRLIQQEILVMRQIKSFIRAGQGLESGSEKYIVQLYEILEDLKQNAIVLVEEYVPGGDLLSLVQEGRIPLDTVRLYFKQMCLGTRLLHCAGVAHRDIKLENVLIDREKQVCKIADFGYAGIMFRLDEQGRRLNKTKKTFSDLAGTFCYLSPEQQQAMIYEGNYDGELVDVWNLGCVLYMMLTGSSPFEPDYDSDEEGNRDEEEDSALIRDNILNLKVNYNFRVFENNERVKKLLSEGMLVYSDERWSLQQVLDFEW